MLREKITRNYTSNDLVYDGNDNDNNNDSDGDSDNDNDNITTKTN